MKLIGLTGGVGMGKSTAAGLLLEHGVQVVDTDELARQLVVPGQAALQEISIQFGAGFLDEDGNLQRDKLAALIFEDAVERQKLEAILHPRIRAAWREQVAQWRAAGHPLAVVVIPLLFETNAAAEFTETLCIACSPATQHERLSQRGWSEEQITGRIAAQLPIARKMELATRVAWNEGTEAVLSEQLLRIIH